MSQHRSLPEGRLHQVRILERIICRTPLKSNHDIRSECFVVCIDSALTDFFLYGKRSLHNTRKILSLQFCQRLNLGRNPNPAVKCLAFKQLPSFIIRAGHIRNPGSGNSNAHPFGLFLAAASRIKHHLIERNWLQALCSSLEMRWFCRHNCCIILAIAIAQPEPAGRK